jgi:hypothetical protein
MTILLILNNCLYGQSNLLVSTSLSGTCVNLIRVSNLLKMFEATYLQFFHWVYKVPPHPCPSLRARSTSCYLISLLTLMPSQRETARKGLSARRVRMERKAGISAAPAQIAARLIRDSYTTEKLC